MNVEYEKTRANSCHSKNIWLITEALLRCFVGTDFLVCLFWLRSVKVRYDIVQLPPLCPCFWPFGGQPFRYGLAWLGLAWLGLAWLGFRPEDTKRPLLVLFPPNVTANQTIRRAAALDARIVGHTPLKFGLILQSDTPGLPESARKAGAWLVFDVQGHGYCSGNISR